MKRFVKIGLSSIAAGLLVQSGLIKLEAQKKNVLFIMADDFNHWAHCIGYYPQSITPNVDKLASKGVLFTDAQCSSPVCNPSRNALWSGLRPSTTGISTNGGGYVRDIAGFENIVSMHQYFGENGYYTYGGGKLWHPSRMGAHETDPEHWSSLYTEGTGSPGGNIEEWTSPSQAEGGLWTWGAGDFDVETSNDTKMARHMAEFISSYSKEKPFFVGCGFFRPHLPWHVAKQFWDLFSSDTLNIPAGYLENDLDDIPGATNM